MSCNVLEQIFIQQYLADKQKNCIWNSVQSWSSKIFSLLSWNPASKIVQPWFLFPVFANFSNYSRLFSILLRDILSCQILQNAMDALANPENINRVIIVWLDEYSTVLLANETEESEPGVQILNNFTKDYHPNTKNLVYFYCFQNFKNSFFLNLGLFYSVFTLVFHPSWKHLHTYTSLCSF